MNNRVGYRIKLNMQRTFLLDSCKRTDCKSLRALSYKMNLNYSTLKKYAREELLLPLRLAYVLSKTAKLDLKAYGIKYILPPEWGASKGGKIGIRVLNNRYKNSLRVWRKKGNKRWRLKPIKNPKFNEKLAELVGAILGDGTLTYYFVRISGDSRYDIKYFKYLSTLIKDSFGINSSTYEDNRKQKHILYLQISSRLVCQFLHKECGLPYGNKLKRRINLTDKIIGNRINAAACLRGLIDTDGSVSKRGSQFCIQFYNYHNDLIELSYKLGKSFGVFTYKLENETGTNSAEKVRRYFKTIGSSNLRHIIRFREYLNGNLVYLKDAVKKAGSVEYINITLPYLYTGL